MGSAVPITGYNGPEPRAESQISMSAFHGKKRRWMVYASGRRHLLSPKNLKAPGWFRHDFDDHSGDRQYHGDNHLRGVDYRHGHDLRHDDGRYRCVDYRDDEESRSTGGYRRDDGNRCHDDFLPLVDHRLGHDNFQVDRYRSSDYGRVEGHDRGPSVDDVRL